MEPIFGTWSFGDVHGSLAGPFVSILLGDGSGSADEGISVEATEDVNRMTTGADGSGFHTLIEVKAARITIRLLKMSPQNYAMQQALSAQRASSVSWGKNVIAVANPVTGDQLLAIGVAFSRQPSNTYAKDPNIIEWHFDSIRTTIVMGGSTVAYG